MPSPTWLTAITPGQVVRTLLAAASVVLLSACGTEPDAPPKPPKTAEEAAPDPAVPTAVPTAVLEPAAFAALPGWRADPVAEALPALKRSCGRLLRGADDRLLGPDGQAGSVADWRQPCQALTAAADDAALRLALEDNFKPLRVVALPEDRGLFTGYYEPELPGALAPDETHRWPLYRAPSDLISVDLARFDQDLAGKSIVGRLENGQLVPYHSRKAIDDGVLHNRNLEVLWLADPVEAFFLHIQGSGKVILPDGSAMRVGYAASNGLPFESTGRYLLRNGKIGRDQATAQGVAAWLRDNPVEAVPVMQRNSRYIFFRPIEGEGPVGAQGVALTPGRSLAIDRRYLPLGAPIWLDTTWPGTDRPLQRLVVAQDVGSAIKGVVRGDLYWGGGAPALEQAGRMKQPGSYYLLLPRRVAERRLATQ